MLLCRPSARVLRTNHADDAIHVHRNYEGVRYQRERRRIYKNKVVGLLGIAHETAEVGARKQFGGTLWYLAGKDRIECPRGRTNRANDVRPGHNTAQTNLFRLVEQPVVGWPVHVSLD